LSAPRRTANKIKTTHRIARGKIGVKINFIMPSLNFGGKKSNLL
jgi:hypothetical protein